MNKSSITIKRCENKLKRLNLKGKRKRNLVKKAMELDKMVDMDVLIVCKCRDTGKITIYESGDHQDNKFTLHKAIAEIDAWITKGRVIKQYANHDYAKLKLQKNDCLDEEFDD